MNGDGGEEEEGEETDTDEMEDGSEEEEEEDGEEKAGYTEDFDNTGTLVDPPRFVSDTAVYMTSDYAVKVDPEGTRFFNTVQLYKIKIDDETGEMYRVNGDWFPRGEYIEQPEGYIPGDDRDVDC